MDIENEVTKAKQTELLMKIRDLCEDLKVARSGSVRGFIFDSLYSGLGRIERCIDELFTKKSELEKELRLTEAKMATKDRLSKLQSEMCQRALQDEKSMMSETYQANLEDQQLAQISIHLSSEIDNEIPQPEISSYLFPHLYSIDESLSGENGYGKMIYSEERAKMYDGPVYPLDEDSEDIDGLSGLKFEPSDIPLTSEITSEDHIGTKKMTAKEMMEFFDMQHDKVLIPSKYTNLTA